MDAIVANEIRERVQPALRQMILLAEERNLESLRLEHEGATLHIRRQASPRPAPAPAAEAAPPSAEPSPARQEDPAEARMVPVRSTLVGVFRPTMPGGKTVAVGAQVEEGQVLACIESMRMMYEVKAPRGGQLAEILVEDGHAVEYGQPLLVLHLS